jgi:anti-sigma B factor antagonist
MAQISPQRFADALVLRIEGRLDNETSEAFGRALAGHVGTSADNGVSVVLDLSALDYVSSSGLNSLMLASREAKAKRGALYVAEPQPLVKEMFEISHLNLVLNVFGTVRDALAKVSAEAVAAYEAAPLK